MDQESPNYTIFNVFKVRLGAGGSAKVLIMSLSRR